MPTITNVRNSVEHLARVTGLKLRLEANSPGDRYGTRYSLHIVREDDRLGVELCRGLGSTDMVEKIQAMWSLHEALERAGKITQD